MEFDMDIKLRFLIDILNKKFDVMTEIYNISVNQKTMMTMTDDCAELLKETAAMVKEKTTCVNDLDMQFQKEYNDISKRLSDEKEQFKGYISLMKDKIKSNTEMKLKIKLQEEKNRELIENVKWN